MNAVRYLAAPAVIGLALAVGGCHMDVEKTAEGKEKKVDIRTPLGGLKVRTDDVSAKDTGLPVYPGAVPVEDRNEKDTNKANVNISTPWFGVKVVAMKFETTDPQDKVISFYDKEMKAHGEVTRCEGDIDFRMKEGEKMVQCKPHSGSRDETQLVVGNERRHRIVSVKKRGDKTEIALVYVNTRGEEDTM